VEAFAAIVLAGGRARRMAGALKPALPVGGEAMLRRVLTATAAARPRVVVGPADLAPLLPAGVRLTTEEPPGGGPVAGLAAGLALIGLVDDVPIDTVAVVAGDLPFLDATVMGALRSALSDSTLSDPPLTGSALTGSAADGVVLMDGDGRPQWLAGVWRLRTLVDRIRALGDPAGQSMRQLVEDLRVLHVDPAASGPPPWFDCDTVEDLRRAEELADDAR
jgi:molybdopterin-guanine dinucleotide biosynthesis protein A